MLHCIHYQEGYSKSYEHQRLFMGLGLVTGILVTKKNKKKTGGDLACQ